MKKILFLIFIITSVISISFASNYDIAEDINSDLDSFPSAVTKTIIEENQSTSSIYTFVSNMFRKDENIKDIAVIEETSVNVSVSLKYDNQNIELGLQMEKETDNEIQPNYFHYENRKDKYQDPFKSLIVKELLEIENSSAGQKMLNIESIKLIGIISNENNKLAIFKDSDSKGEFSSGYYLREGDSVKRGKLFKIYKDRVIFSQRDFDGWQQIEMKIEE